MNLRLRQIRKAKKCSQAMFARILGVTTATYSKYERHRIAITAQQLGVLSMATDVPIEDFYERAPAALSSNGNGEPHV